jgi:hypothetical protein
VVAVFSGADPFLPQSSGVGVVFQIKRAVQTPGNLGANVEILPSRQIGRRHQNALFHSDDARNSHANTGQLIDILPALYQLQYPAAQAIDDVFPSPLDLRQEIYLIKESTIFVDCSHS